MASITATSTAVAAGPTPPPSGDLVPPVQQDFVYSASQGQATVAFGAIITVITTASVVARLYARYFVTKQVRIDDAWALGALLSAICVNVMQSVFILKYLPTMTAMITADNEGSRIPYATSITYNISMTLLKMTFLFQFYHIFQHVRVMKFVYMGAIVFVGAWSLAQILLAVLVCLPIEANWNLNVSGVTCLPTSISTYVNATGTITTDVVVLFLPLPTLWSLRLRGRQIWAVFGVFGIGALVPIISAGRIWSLGHPPPKGYMSTACWTIAELGVGITTASLATIRHLKDRKVTQLLSSHHQSARRDSFAADTGAASQGSAQPYPSGTSGSEVDLIAGNRTGTGDSVDLKSFTKKKVFQTSANAFTPDKGSTRTRITSSRNKEMTMSQGAATFLGEFGILVEKTWEIEEIRME